MRKLLPFLGGILVGFGIGIFILFGLLNIHEAIDAIDISDQVEPFPIHINTPAPNFELENLFGQSVQLGDFHGKTVLLNFWATWCAPCRIEMPYLQTRYEISNDKFALLAVNNGENYEDVETFVKEYGLTFDVLLDPNAEVQSLFRVRGYPTTILIDPEGIIRFQHIGIMTEDQLDHVLQKYSAED